MASPTEDDHFRPGIAALRASRADEAQAHFQAAIDAGLATTKSWLGLTLASLVGGDNRAAEASVDEVLAREPHNLRGLSSRAICCWAGMSNAKRCRTTI